MPDSTASLRRLHGEVFKAEAALATETPDPKAALAKRYGQLWTTREMREDFTPMGFQAPYIVVTRKSDGQKGSMAFSPTSPRFYHSFEPHKP